MQGLVVRQRDGGLVHCRTAWTGTRNARVISGGGKGFRVHAALAAGVQHFPVWTWVVLQIMGTYIGFEFAGGGTGGARRRWLT